MLAIFVAFVVGVIIGKMELFVISGRAIRTVVILLAMVFAAWAISNPQEVRHWQQYYSYQLFGTPATTHGSNPSPALWGTKP